MEKVLTAPPFRIVLTVAGGAVGTACLPRFRGRPPAPGHRRMMDTDLHFHEEYDTEQKFIEDHLAGWYALMIDGKGVRFSELSPQQQARSSVECRERDVPRHQRIARRVVS